MKRWHYFLVAVLLMAPAVAQAQTTQVSNLTAYENEGMYIGGSSTNDQVAQSFTTGAHQTGYVLGTIKVYIAQFPSTATDLTAELWNESGGNPGSRVATLSFDSTNTGEKTLTPATQTTLAASTDYFLLFRNGYSGVFSAGRARVDAKSDNDETAEAGWSIADDRRHRQGAAGWGTSSYSLKLEVVAEAANIPATGRPTISGTAQVGQTLTAATSAIADSDGLGDFTFQWARFSADGNTREANIGTDSDTYTLTDDEENKKVKVSVTFTDAEGNSEGPLTSAAFPTSGTIFDEPDNPATGRPAISGTPRVGQTLTAATSAIADSDGLGTFTFQWARFAADGTTREATIGTNSSTYTLTDNEANKKVKVSVTFTDGEGNSEGPLTSDAFPSSGTIDDEPNNPATGRPTISGTPRVGQTLTAATSAIADSDGLGTFTFQWARFAADGTTREATIGTNSRTYTLTDNEENKRVKVSVTFTDGEGNSEGPLTSAAFPSSGTIDDEPDDGDDPPDDGDDPPDDGDDDEPGGGDDGQDEPVETPALPLAGAAVLAALLAAAGARARRA